jgi:peptidoglycan/LPS O-acetylase OafA/YrhL
MTAAMHLGLDDRLIVPLAGALVLSLALFSKTQANKDASGGLVPLLGEASYALYLTHIPLFTAWRGIVAALTDRPSSYQLGWIEAGAMLVTAQLVAIVLFIGFERPVRDWIKSRLGRTASPRSNSSTGDA